MKFLSTILLLPLFFWGQTQKNRCEILSKINSLIQENHYKPKPVDDSLSVFVFKTFLEKLDEDNRYFLSAEIAALQKHQYKIDDYINSNDCSFLNEFYLAYNKSIIRYDKIIQEIKNEDFPFSSTEKIQFSKKSFPYVNTVLELKKLYKKRILFHTLRDIAEKSRNKDSLTQIFNSICTNSKNKIIESYSCKTASLQLAEEDFYSMFYNVFCSYFDPHTMYFSANEKSSFLSNISADNLTFGIYVSINENEEIAVDEVIPGSSAYFSDKINSGDQIVKLKHNTDEYVISCASLKKVEEIFTSNDYKNVAFTLRKKTGEIYTVNLEKTVMKDYQNNVYSYIIVNNNKKIGYIKIPSFYAQVENSTTNLSNDVSKEIVKLKKDAIDALIIDVENNGGGSMEEAIKLTGMFIDVGPIAVLKNQVGETEVIKDFSRGTVFDKPMAVLVNGFSASASEFFASAMQEYNRALIIGSATYGKATMQSILPLENEKENTDFLKITIEEFYGVSGKTNQYSGIIPDVAIPTLFEKQSPKEKDEKTALKNDTISKEIRYNALDKRNKVEQTQIAIQDLQHNASAKEITKLNEQLNLLYDNDLPPILLNFSTVFDEVNKVNLLWKNIENFAEKEHNLQVERTSTDVEYQKFDAFLTKTNADKIKAIKTNLSIFEAVNCLTQTQPK